MKKSKLHLHPLAAAIALMSGTVALPQIAFAADEAREEEEVLVVSARRRDESLQEVPISLSSFTGAALEKQGIIDIVQIGQSVPNTTLKVSRGSNTTITAFIRGIGQQDPVAGFESGVGIYLDDIYLNRPQGAVLDVYDVERVEILRGPQGTLYGRNTIGGAIKYITKRLGDEPQISFKGTLGQYSQTDLVVSGSSPVGDIIKLGGSLAIFKRDGFGEAINTGAENYDKDIFAGRISMEVTPSDELYIRVAADYTVDNSNTKYGRRIDAGVPTIDTYDSLGDVTEINHPINKNKVTGSGIAAFVEYEISDSLTFKSTTAFREDETDTPIDFDSLTGQRFDVLAAYENEQLSQEFQIIFNYDRVAGSAGLYYLDANAFNAFDVVLNGAFQGLVDANPPGTFPSADITSFTIGDVDTKTWAIFGEVSVDVSDTVELTLGGRYTDDERTARVQREGFFVGDNGVSGSPYFGGNGISRTTQVLDDNGNEVLPVFNGSKSDTAFTPKVSVAWKPSDDANLYASYSQGFKGGGFDPRGNYAEPVVREGFDAETVDSYEIGFKSNAYDGQIKSNLAFFYSDYRDVQIPSSIPVDRDGDGVIDDFVGVTTNAGKAKIVGTEWDVTLNFTDNLTAIVTVGLIDADYIEYTDASGADVSDARVFQNTPSQTGSLTLSYDVSVGPGELTLTSNINYRSETFQDEGGFELLTQPGYSLINLSAVWNSDDDHWQAGLHVHNASDKEYIVAGYNFGFVTAYYGNPRQVFATVKYNLF